MVAPADRIIQAQFLSNWTLVRLPDGQVGVFTRRGTLSRVTLPGQTGVDVEPDTELEIVKHPAELALEAMERYYAPTVRRQTSEPPSPV